MMRKLFVLGTALFWLCILTIWASGLSQNTALPDRPSAAEKRIHFSEIAQHVSGENCWMAIDGAVYDLSAYLPEHPTKPGIILPWCGKDASEAYRTKMKGRPHSPEADRLLIAYKIGVLENASAGSRGQ